MQNFEYLSRGKKTLDSSAELPIAKQLSVLVTQSNNKTNMVQITQLSSLFIFATVLTPVFAAPRYYRPREDDLDTTLVRRAYVVAGCGSSGGQLPAYCTSDCKCSGIGVYGCDTPEKTKTCKSKGCGCSKS